MKTFLLEQIGQVLILVLWKSISSLLKIVAVKKRDSQIRNQFVENLDGKYRIVDIKSSTAMMGLMHYSAMILYDLK